MKSKDYWYLRGWTKPTTTEKEEIERLRKAFREEAENRQYEMDLWNENQRKKRKMA